MNTKKLKLYVLAASLTFASIPVSLNAKNTVNEPPTTTTSKSEEKAEAAGLLNRLYEIYDMRKSNLTHAEKLELGQEVKEINNKLKNDGGGIYISVGAALIIIILLILFL